MKQILFYFIILFMMLILVVIKILLSVAFLTLMERKLLGFMQFRKGPNKLGFWGVIQPFSDAIKLMMKEDYFMIKINSLYYYYSPMFMLILSLMMWMIYPFYTNLLMMKFGFIYLVSCMGLGGYGLLISGWSSNSMYSMMGSLRSLAQSISYEVSLVIILISSIILIENFNLMNFMNMQMNCYMFMFMWPLSFMLFFCMLAELNRTPFDFSEGESELVSGFNVEYGGSGFVLIFLSEYSSILFMSFIFSMMYLGNNMYDFEFYVKILIISFIILWIRASLPRFRYDMLMYFSWMLILPFSLNFMFYVLIMKILLN